MPDDHTPGAALTAPAPTQFTTTDPDEAHAFLRAAYVDNTMRVSGSPERFRMRNTSHDLGDYGFSSLSHTMAVEHTADPLGYVLVGRVQVGQFECETEARTVRAGPHDVFLVAPPDRPYVARWETMRLQLIRVDLPLISEVAGTERVRFTDTEPSSPDAARHLSRTLNYLAETLLTDPVARADTTVVRESGRLLAASVLQAFPNTARA